MNFDTLFKKILWHLTYGSRLKPTRDWYVLLAVGAVLLLGVVLYNVWVFDKLASGQTLGTQTLTAPSLFNRSSLDAIQKVFADRAAEEAKYLNGTYHFADPSR
jgi:hypothetical protein